MSVETFFSQKEVIQNKVIKNDIIFNDLWGTLSHGGKARVSLSFKSCC